MHLGEDERLTVCCVCVCLCVHSVLLTIAVFLQRIHAAATRSKRNTTREHVSDHLAERAQRRQREGKGKGQLRADERVFVVCVYGMGRTTLKKTGATCPRFRHSPFNSIDLNRSTHTPLLPGLHTHLLQGESAGSRVSHYASSTPVHPSLGLPLSSFTPCDKKQFKAYGGLFFSVFLRPRGSIRCRDWTVDGR